MGLFPKLRKKLDYALKEHTVSYRHLLHTALVSYSHYFPMVSRTFVITYIYQLIP